LSKGQVNDDSDDDDDILCNVYSDVVIVVITRVYLVHSMNAEQYHAAADPQTKPADSVYCGAEKTTHLIFAIALSKLCVLK